MAITGEIKSQVDSVWNDFWSGGISNPIDVLDQLTYLLFVKGLDDTQIRAENKANRIGVPLPDNVPFPEGRFSPSGIDRSLPYSSMRWSKLRNLGSAAELFDRFDNYIFPFLRERVAGSTHGEHMSDARLKVLNPELLLKVFDGIDAIKMTDRDTKGDVYEYMLSKLASAKQAGQFRTPRHIISLMVEMMAPQPKDTICDPASGTSGFLVAASEYVRREHAEIFSTEQGTRHFNTTMFNGFDFDNTMLRIGSMNMQMHGIESPNIALRDSLSQDSPRDAEKYSLVLANPPFKGSLDYEGVADDLLAFAKTKKTELLFLTLFLRQLKPGGRAAVIVPDGVLFGSTKAHKEIRRALVEDQKLDAVVSLPSGVFKPYAGVSTAILLFTKTNSGGTDHVWFYDLAADGFSLDDKRTALLDGPKLGPLAQLSEDEHPKNNLPDVLTRWKSLVADPSAELARERTEQSFCVPKPEIVENEYDLSLNRYKEIVYEAIDYPEPEEIIAELKTIEAEIADGLAKLEGMLK